MTSSHPTRLKDIKDILEELCEYQWTDDSTQVTIPLSIWPQITIEEIALILLGREDVKDYTVARDVPNRRVVLEIKNGRQYPNVPRNICSDRIHPDSPSAV